MRLSVSQEPRQQPSDGAGGMRPEAGHRGEAAGRVVTMRVFRGDAQGGDEVEYRVPVETGMVVLDAIH